MKTLKHNYIPLVLLLKVGETTNNKKAIGWTEDHRLASVYQIIYRPFNLPLTIREQYLRSLINVGLLTYIIFSFEVEFLNEDKLGILKLEIVYK